jgi:menaquinol-cytochrome c reductase iron-sulfur subunit
MSNHETHDSDEHVSERKSMTRRQFLAYTLGGTTAFLAVTPVLPMVRFAVDALFQSSSSSDFVKVCAESEITNEPKEFKFQISQKDGWYESTPTLVAWISKNDAGQIFALSPICKHLGCTVLWNVKGLNEYDCPCHDARYTRDGKYITVADASLDEYEVQIIDGYVYLGNIIANTRS